MNSKLLSIQAPMSARVLLLAVRPGDAVLAGAPLLVLELMKMEHELRAPADALVEYIACARANCC